MKSEFVTTFLGVVVLLFTVSVVSADETLQLKLAQKKLAAKKGVEELTKDLDIVWARTFGGELLDGSEYSQQTSDGGYIIVGSTMSYGAGSSDVYLIKTDSSGKKKWSKTFGGEKGDWVQSARQTTDGGYIIAGMTKNIKGYDMGAFLLKTDSSGNEEWSKTFGGEKADWAFSVQQTTDGGYIAAGSTSSYGSGLKDVFLLKTDSSGNEEWSKTFGREKNDSSNSVQQTSDGGYIVAGYTSTDGSVSNDFYVIKTDSSGNEEWSKTFGGKMYDSVDSIHQTTDGGYVITGTTTSFGSGSYDILLIKLAPKPKKKPEQK